MIGVTGENLLSAIELFEQHPSDQQMGPGQRPKREDYLGAVENHRVETSGAADGEGEFKGTPVPPGGDPLGQCAAGPLDAALVEGSPAVPAGVQRAMRMQLALLEFRLAISRGSCDEAAAGLTQLCEEQTPGICDARWTLQLQLQLAAAHARSNRAPRARDILTRALKTGAGNGLCMSFIDAGQFVRELIATLCHEPPMEDLEILDLLPYSRNLLRHFDRTATPKGLPKGSPKGLPKGFPAGPRRLTNEVNQSLTKRESGILQLIADGLSNKRIAQRLDITPETVKSHAKNIFFKLAAQTRAQAVARAEALGII